MADVNEAIEFMREVMDADADNRDLALTDLKFRYGEQWPQYAIASRGLDRPQLTINEMDSYIRQVTNSQRQQRPRIKVHPVDDFADPKIAKVITGLTRHIEVNSDADNAYDIAFDFAATIGWGFWRIRTDYISNDTFNQDIFIDSIDNPFCVYFDPASRLPDGSDGQKCLITDMMRKDAFKRDFPEATLGGFTERGTGDNDPNWATDHEIRVAEYFYLDRIKAKLVMLSDGSLYWSDQLPPEGLLQRAQLTIKGDRESYRQIVKWQKQTAYDVLEKKDLPGKYIPVVPVYWTNVRMNEKILRQGLVRPGMDAQRMINFWQTSITESIALAPKAKWVGAEGFDEGHEQEFKSANLSPNPVLRYKTTGVDGKPIPPPERMQPEPPPSGAIEASMLANQNLQRVMGMFDPAQQPGNKSGKAIVAERQQSENSNYHGYDNLTRSIKHTGRIILSYIPVIYDTQRVQRIIGDDGAPDLVTINEKTQGQSPEGQAIQKVLNDVTVGTYDVVMDTGPGYDTKRIQGVDSMMQLMNTPIGEKVAQVGDDLIVRQMDFNGSDVLADRLAAANPLSQIDDKSDIPPQAQMQMKAMQQQIQQLTQQLQQAEQVLKSRADLKQMEERAETNREHMRLVVKAHDIETRDAQTQRDVTMETHTRANDAAMGYKKAMDVEEIRAHLAILLTKMDEMREKTSDDVKGEAVENAV